MITKGPKPWKHQLAALRFVHTRRGSLLWLPMGAGKSRVVVDYIQNTEKGPTLILCPLKVVKVWPAEFEKYAVDAPPVTALDRGSVKERAEIVKSCKGFGYGVIVVNYDAAKMEPLAKELLKVPWARVVMDECHRIKSAGGATSRFVAKLCKPCRKIIGLSGTPLTTGLKGKGGKKIGGWLDIYGQARAIVPGLYGYTHAAFKSRYGIWMQQPFPKLLDDVNQEEFQAKLSSFCFHVGEDELAVQLPETTEQRIPVELPASVLQAYRTLEDEFIAAWDDDTVSASNALVKQLRLQQMAGGFFQPDTEEPPKPMHSEKFEAIAELLEDIPPEDKVVVFCRFRPEIAELTSVVEKAKRKPFYMIGGQDTSEQWKASSGGVILVQISAGAEGVDLTAARYCIYCSLCHSLKDYSQSRKRIHRPGQTRPVTYYHIVAEGTIDEEIYAALEAKEEVVESVRQRLRLRRQNYNGN